MVNKRTAYLKATYDMTPAQYNAMLKAQNNSCAICGRASGRLAKLHIDHDHVTGKVRGLLCRTCNLRLGWFEQYPKQIAAYLRRANTAALPHRATLKEL